MGYRLGIDLGTTYTAAAIFRDGRAEIVELGTRAASVPSALFVREDDEVLTGEPALRRGMTEPGRLAREFKRRLGDSTAIRLGGAPYSAESLMARMLRWVVDTVAQREGGAPEAVTVCHPANWGPFKRELLQQALQLADLPDADTITEPEAAAISYASTERVEPGTVVAVYDLGGGTFDAAVLRKAAGGFEILGTPEGIEHLGGIDFDEAILAHVSEAAGDAVQQLDPSDPGALAEAARLREEIVAAKEALSSDTEASIPVAIGDLRTQVRLTRAEFEGMIRPAISETIGALRRALRSAEVEPDDVSRVLLVGGSSRIPLVSEMVSAEVGRPVAVDAHPKHAIPLGAALSAAGLADDTEALTAADLFALPEEGETTPVTEPREVLRPRPVEPFPEEKEAAPVSEPKTGRNVLVAVLAVVLLGAAAGGAWALGLFGGSDTPPEPKKTNTPTVINTGQTGNGGGDGTQTTTQPTGCTATDPITVVAADTFSFNPNSFEVCPGQSVTVRNDGTVTHNFSVSSAGIDQDVAPGSEVPVGAPSDSLEPGTYDFSCKYYASSGMTGQFTLSG